MRQDSILRSIVLSLAVMFFLPPILVHAFCPQRHRTIIAAAFLDKPEILEFVDDEAVKRASDERDYPVAADIDYRPNPPVVIVRIKNQPHYHSMRADGATLAVARARVAQYLQEEMTAAVYHAKWGRKPEASMHLGQALHAIQDGKHNWSFCSPDSNPPDSNPGGPDLGCSESETGCPLGRGHHGLRISCIVPRDVSVPEIIWKGGVAAILNWDSSRFCQGYTSDNFQIRTDEFPLDPQRNEALSRSIKALDDFLGLVCMPRIPGCP